MNAATQVLRVPGPIGAIDTALDLPGATGGVAAGNTAEVSAIAVIAHPHPLFGGTRDNKVVQTIARALLQAGCACWRPNFRGIGATAGVFDEGRGEADDLLAVIDYAAAHASAKALAAPIRLYLAGFSFGSFVQATVAQRIDPARFELAPMILIGTAASRFEVPLVDESAIVIHGELDDVVPLQSVMDWARPQGLPVTVIPGSGHFFHGQLNRVKSLILRNLGVSNA